MKDDNKTKAQLIEELVKLRQEVARLKEDEPGNATEGLNRDITERKQAEKIKSNHAAQLVALNEISLAVLEQFEPYAVYQIVTQSLVNYFDMSFAQVWILDETSNDLVLQVSAGEYTHTDGAHGRVSLDSNRKLAWIAKQREPHITNDLLNDPRVDDKAWVQESNTVAFAGYPLTAGDDDLQGVLGMFSHQPIPDETLPLLQSLAVLMSTLVNNQRLFKQATLRAHQLTTVTEVSTQTATMLDPGQLLQTVVNLTKEEFGLYHAHIYLLDKTGTMLNLTAGAGDVGRQMVAQGWRIPVKQDQSVVARTATSKQGVIVNNVREASDWLPNPLLPNTHSELAVPMIVGDKILGVLDVQADKINRFTDDDVRIQTTLASQVAVALENARLFEREYESMSEMEHQAYHLTLLNKMSKALSQITKTDKVFDIVAGYTTKIAGIDRASIALITPDSEQFEVLALDGIKGAIPTGMKLPLDGTAVGVAIRERRMVMTPDTRQSDFFEHEQLRKQGVLSTLLTPLVASDEVIGTLNVGSKKLNAYGPQDENLLLQIASLLASTLESRRLFEEAQTRVHHERVLREITTRVRGSTSPDAIVRTAVRELGIALNRSTFVRLGDAKQLLTRPNEGKDKDTA